MDDLTRQHWDLGQANYAIATAILPQVLGAQLPVPAGEWTTVIAFYATVHWVNAYLWERRRFRPASHRERNASVRTEPELAAVRRAYGQLHSWAWDTRYTPGFRLPTAEIGAAFTFAERVRIEIARQLGIVLA